MLVLVADRSTNTLESTWRTAIALVNATEENEGQQVALQRGVTESDWLIDAWLLQHRELKVKKDLRQN